MINHIVYVHIGKKIPDYIFDSIYQTLFICPETKIYVILDESLIEYFRNMIYKLNVNYFVKQPITLNLYVECIPIQILQVSERYTNYINNLPDSITHFRDSFWISTTMRFFYIESFMKIFKINNVFHLENDIMLYKNVNQLDIDKNKIYMLKDSPNRVIPSLLFFPNNLLLQEMNTNIIEQLKDIHVLLNDMQLLGAYKNDNICYFSSDFNDNLTYIVDGAAIGQFLGGLDLRNLQEFLIKSLEEQQLLHYNNPTKGFVNETSSFKPDSITIFKNKIFLKNMNFPVDLYYAKREDDNNIMLKQIVNLHIHSKQLHEYSIINHLKYSDIITGERVVSLCDFIILTRNIFDYHENLNCFINNNNNLIIVDDFKTINMQYINSYIRLLNKSIIKIFVYTHIIDSFIKYILPYLEFGIKYILYLHNSDDCLTSEHMNILMKSKYIKIVYSQNMNKYMTEKFKLIPIGIANSMFEHGNLLQLYEVISKTYYKKKENNLYISINPNTFEYRRNVLEEIRKKGNLFKINHNKPFKEYLYELSSYFFCLCIRGNGISCHREWECYYLGVIPVIINNKYTNTDAYVKYLQKLNLPFFEIKEENLDKYSNDFFNEDLYNKILHKCNSSPYNLPALSIDYYK